MTMTDSQQRHRTPFFLVITGLILATVIGAELSLYIGITAFGASPMEIVFVTSLMFAVVGVIAFFELRKLRKDAPFASWREVGPFERLCFIAGVLFFSLIAIALFKIDYGLMQGLK